uniref:Exocyst component Exo84 C-terminal domain-containing protein n=2 Tax=Spongospora subterranea TaxID=70186 RepID=A0A0H5R3Z8_9EUKA|eukprot:CRZ08636.1 hypothetical protein [Spongospora subterranea]
MVGESFAPRTKREALKRSAKGIYERRKRAAVPEARRNDASSPENPRQMALINLRTTLELFGLPTFRVETYMAAHFSAPVDDEAHKQELLTRKTLMNETLKSFVTDNYNMFIHTSKEIEYIESDLSNLHNTLGQYKTAIKRLQDIPITKKDTHAILISKISSGAKNVNSTILIDIIDELNTLIYERKLEQATELVDSSFDRVNTIDATDIQVEDAHAKLTIEKDKLVCVASEMFKSPALKPQERRRYINCIVKLGRMDKALDLFVEQRSSMIRIAQGQIRSTGDLTSYITDVSGVVFSSIGTGWIEFKRIFKNHALNSRFFTWATSELETFGNLVRHQVFRADSSFRTVCQCVHLTVLACKMLEKQGLKFSFMFEKLFLDDLRSAFQTYSITARQIIAKALSTETWEIEQTWIKQPSKIDVADKLSITRSARSLYDVVHQFIQDMRLLIFNPIVFDPTVNDLLPLASTGIRVMFEEYLLNMATVSKSEATTDAQGIAILSNSYFLAEDLFPRIIKQLTQRIPPQRGMTEILNFHDQLMKFYKAQREFFCQKRGEKWISDIIKWNSEAEKWFAPLDSPVDTPSAGFMSFGVYLIQLGVQVNKCLEFEVPRIQSRAVAEVLSQLRSDASWSHVPAKLNPRGYRQLTLDMAFMKMAEGGSGFYQEAVMKYSSEIMLHAKKRLETPIETIDESWADKLIDCLPEKTRLTVAIKVTPNKASEPISRLISPNPSPARGSRAQSTLVIRESGSSRKQK